MRRPSIPDSVSDEPLPATVLIAVAHSAIHLMMLVLFLLVLSPTQYGEFFTSAHSGLSLLGMWSLIAALLTLILLCEAWMRKSRRWKVLLLVAASAMIGHQVMYRAVGDASNQWSAAYRIPRLMRELESTEFELRHRAVWSLAWYEAESRAAVPILMTALGDESRRIRSAASYALGAIGHDSRPALSKLEALSREDPDWQVRDSARRAIARIAK